ncbi:MAG: hypothetical protein ACE366_09785 [Bradymonadia bacterium]
MCDTAAGGYCLYGEDGGMQASMPDVGADAGMSTPDAEMDADLSDAGMPDAEPGDMGMMDAGDMDLSDMDLSDMDLSDMGPDMDPSDMGMMDAGDMDPGDADLPDMEMADVDLPDMEAPDMDLDDDSGIIIDPPIDGPDFSGQYAVTRTVVLTNVPDLEVGQVENTSISISPDPNPPVYRIVVRDVQGQRLSEARAMFFDAEAIDDLEIEFRLELEYTTPIASPPLLCFGSTISDMTGNYLFDAGDAFEFEGTENERLDYSGDNCVEEDRLTVYEVRWNRLD